MYIGEYSIHGAEFLGYEDSKLHFVLKLKFLHYIHYVIDF